MSSTAKLTSALTRSLRNAAPRARLSSSLLPPSFLLPAWSSSSRLLPTAALRPFSTTPRSLDLSSSSRSTTEVATESTEEALVEEPKKTPIGKIERRLQITFTCTAAVPIDGRSIADLGPGEEVDGKACGHRSTHEFSRRSYEKGIVLIECPGCKNRHLIADNLQWFSQTPSPAHPEGQPIGQETKSRTVEDLVKEKGEQVKWLDGGPQGGTWTLE